MKFLLLLMSLSMPLAVSSCRTLSDDSKTLEDTSGANYQHALDQAGDELAQLETLSPAKNNELFAMLGHDLVSFNNFQKLRGRHVLLMFLKNTGITEDDRRGGAAAPADGLVGSEPILSSPVEFNLNANLLVRCDKFVNEKGFAQIDKTVFTQIPEQDRKELYCSTLRIWPSNDQRSTRSKGDVKEVWLYLDSLYRPYGKELFVYENKSDVKSYRTGLDPAYSTSSQIDGVPYDVPNLNALGHMLSAGTALPKVRRVASPALPKDPFFAKQLAKRNIKLCPQGNAVEMLYENKGFGSAQRVTWCKGDAWPTIIDNPMFIAVLAKQSN